MSSIFPFFGLYTFSYEYISSFLLCFILSPSLTDVTVASSESLLALTLILVGLLVGAGAAIFAGLMGATVVQIWKH